MKKDYQTNNKHKMVVTRKKYFKNALRIYREIDLFRFRKNNQVIKICNKVALMTTLDPIKAYIVLNKKKK